MSTPTSPNTSDDVVTRPITETTVDFEQLHRSATNPRKRFLPQPLKELAENILKWGVQTRLHVRPSKEEPGKFEIIAGERRHRALEIAMQMVESQEDAGIQIQRLMQVPVKVTDWNDDEVIDFQLIENVQREDLTPLEEADSFAQMVKRGKSVEDIASHINREANYIYRALKWARLPDLAREAFERGILKKELATMIARVPDEKMRLRATLELVFFPHDLVEDDEEIEKCSKDAWAYLKDEAEAIEPMSVKDAREQMARHYMKSLKGAPFKLEDDELMPVERDAAGERLCGGACSDCPFRTGNNQLFAGEMGHGKSNGRKMNGRAEGIDENTCTNPPCFRTKMSRLWERTKAEAGEKGVVVLEPEKEDEIFYHSSHIRYGSPYVDLNEKPSRDLVDTGSGDDDEDDEEAEKKLPTWKKLLKNVEVQRFVTLDRDGVPHTLVKRDVAITAVNERAKASGEASIFSKASKSGNRPSSETYQQQLKKQQEEKKRGQRAFAFALENLRMSVTEKGVDADGWEKLAESMVLDLDMDGVRLLAASMDIKPETPSKKEGSLNSGHYAAAIMVGMRQAGPSPLGWQALMIAAIGARGAWRLLDSPLLKATCGHWSVSLTEMKNLAKDEEKQKKAKKANKGASKAKSAAGENEQINADITTDSILAEGDRQREEAPSRGTSVTGDPTEFLGSDKAAGEGIHFCYCDGCGKVCDVTGFEARVWALPEGSFRCSHCGDYTRFRIKKDGGEWDHMFLPLPPEQQGEFEVCEAKVLKPAKPAAKKKAPAKKAVKKAA